MPVSPLAPRARLTSELQAPTDYTGIYEDWNLDLDRVRSKDDFWDFGTATQYPALKADFDGNGEATWQEFGYQVRKSLILTTTLSGAQQVSLSWPDMTETDWTGSPQVSYALYRDDAEVTGYDGSSQSYTDTGLTPGQTYHYRVALWLEGVEVRRSTVSSIFLPASRADSDGDGLIEITSLAQLNAVRWDLNGDGLADSGGSNISYTAAFPVASGPQQSCNAGAEGDGACAGYELTADLDFDGASWQPIGTGSSSAVIHRRLRRRRPHHRQPARQQPRQQVRILLHGPVRLDRQWRRGAAPRD